MNRNPYLRAYMAGIAFPTAFLLIPFCLSQFALHAPDIMQRALMFPLALIPNAFGVWNMLFVKLQPHWRHPIGLHGAALPFFIAPLFFVIAVTKDFVSLESGALIYFHMIRIPYGYLAFAPFIAIAAYYLLWKYAVGYLNSVVELPR